MKLHHLILSVICIFLLLFVSCNKELNLTKAKVEFTSDKIVNTQKSTQTSAYFNFDSASLILDKFELNKTIWNDSIADLVEDSIEYFKNLQNIYASFYGPFQINLLTGSSSPKIDIVEIEHGVYNNLEARMGNGNGDSICFYLSGTLITDTESIPFKIELIQGSNFKLTNPSGFEIKENQINIVWVKINLSLLFDGVNFNEADKDIDGLIRINDQSNRNILETIIENLNTFSELGLDQDLNGEIDN